MPESPHDLRGFVVSGGIEDDYVKRLTITYDGNTLYDADVAQLTWQDSQDGGVTVSTKPPPNLTDMFKKQLREQGDANGATPRMRPLPQASK